LSLAAIEAHEAGRDDDAFEYLRDIVALGDSLTTVPTLINYLMAIAIQAHINRPLEDILSGVKIGDAPDCVRLQNIRGLMAELQDVTPHRQGITLAMMGERSMGYDICQRILDLDMPTDQVNTGSVGEIYGDVSDSNRLVRSSYDFFIAPMLRLDGAWGVGHRDAYVRASRVGTLPEFRRAIQQTVQDRDERLGAASFSRPLTTLFTPSLERLFELHYRCLAYRQMAAVAIAVRMHQIDSGRRLDTLEELVPNYLDRIPQDPTDEPGRPIRYVSDPNMPRLYSVGADGRDDGGSYDDLAEHADNRKEILFFLSGRPSVPKEKSDQDASNDDDSDR